jgi:hypothetical protein
MSNFLSAKKARFEIYGRDGPEHLVVGTRNLFFKTR